MCYSFGEKGAIIIFGVIKVTFPHVENHGLSFVNFARRVLLPKAAVLLAQADMGLLRDEAMNVMQISRDYGMTMHPQDDNKEDQYLRDLKSRWGKGRVAVKMEAEERILKLEPEEPVLSQPLPEVECRTVMENGVEIFEIMD
jgi:hypothetical protein